MNTQHRDWTRNTPIAMDIEMPLELPTTPTKNNWMEHSKQRHSEQRMVGKPPNCSVQGANSWKALSSLIRSTAGTIGYDINEKSVELAVETVINKSRKESSSSGFTCEFSSTEENYSSPDSDESASLTHRANTHSQEQETYQHSRSKWHNQCKYNGWLVIYCVITVILFVLSSTLTLKNTPAINVFGIYLAYARGCALLINTNCALVLLPVSRHFHTWLQSRRRLRKILAFDAGIDFHKLLGAAILLFGVSHSLLHIATYRCFVGAPEDALEEFFGTRKARSIPTSRQGRIGFLLRHKATITGIGMLICMAAATAVLSVRRTNFNRFWYLHHLFVVTLVLMCVHGSGSFIAPSQTVYWLGAPLIVYIAPRIYREFCTVATFPQSIEARGNVLAITMDRPAGWEKHQKAGMYAMINIPTISKFEWHPFTISSPPHEDHVKFHISCIGDWTKRAKKLLVKNPVVPIRLEGPFGAPSQGTRDFEVVVLIGAGIGVTPMISTICSLLHRPGKMKRVFFYWTTRESSSFSLFNRAMDGLYEQDTENRLEIRHFLTSQPVELSSDGESELSTFFHHVARKVHEETSVDIRLGHRSREQLQIGRPNWNKEMERVLERTENMGIRKAGIFLCGPDRMATEVQETAFNLSQNRKAQLYFTKETF